MTLSSIGPGFLFAIGLIIAFFFTLLYLFKEQNPVLRLIFLMAIFVSGLFIPTGVYQLRTTCDTVVNSTSVSGGRTDYTYVQQCFTTKDTAPDTFYIVMWGIFQIIMFYWIVHVIIMMAKPVIERIKRW